MVSANTLHQLEPIEPKHFTLETTGHPFKPMNIFVVEACVNGEQLNAGDEIAVYYGDQCVGVSVLNAALSSSNPLEIIARKDDGTSQGFADGHEIGLRIWRSNTGEELSIDEKNIQFQDPNTAQPTIVSRFEGLGTAIVAINSITSIGEENVLIPGDYRLYQNHPNPFNSSTTISYDLLETLDMRLEIYDIRGNVVKKLFEGRQTAGHHVLGWDGRDNQGLSVVSGIYFYKLSSNKFTVTRKMVLTK